MVYDLFFFFKQKTAYEMRISDWSSDVCSSDLRAPSASAIQVSPSTRHSSLFAPTPSICLPRAWPPNAGAAGLSHSEIPHDDRHHGRAPAPRRWDHSQPRGRHAGTRAGFGQCAVAMEPPQGLAGMARLEPWSARSEEHTSELQSLMRNSDAVFCLKK